MADEPEFRWVWSDHDCDEITIEFTATIKDAQYLFTRLIDRSAAAVTFGVTEGPQYQGDLMRGHHDALQFVQELSVDG